MIGRRNAAALVALAMLASACATGADEVVGGAAPRSTAGPTGAWRLATEPAAPDATTATAVPAPRTPATTGEPVRSDTAPAPVSTERQPTPLPLVDLTVTVAATEPAALADQIVAAERAIRDPSSTPDQFTAAAKLQQVAYRKGAANREWDPIIMARVPAELVEVVTTNLEARREFLEWPRPERPDTLPAWRIVEPATAADLLGWYREAEAASGVGWEYLAAINLVETAMGRIEGVSTANAQGPMQFLPTTWDMFGGGGDITDDRDSIVAAGRFLDHFGFAADPARALFRYNNHDRYVRAVTHYARLIAADEAAFRAYHQWDVYYLSASGDLLLPVGYEELERRPAVDYRAEHPQANLLCEVPGVTC